jgi:hypothetical protein
MRSKARLPAGFFVSGMGGPHARSAARFAATTDQAMADPVMGVFKIFRCRSCSCAIGSAWRQRRISVFDWRMEQRLLRARTGPLTRMCAPKEAPTHCRWRHRWMSEVLAPTAFPCWPEAAPVA